MAETDLSKIVNLIMQNPELIEQIKRLGEKNEGAPTPEDKDTSTYEKESEEKEDVPTGAAIEKMHGRTRRRELLCALKPYVSEERGRAIDSMMSIADILDVMRSK